jgi:hypothetical protein
MRMLRLAIRLLPIWFLASIGCESDTPETLIRLVIDSDLAVETELSSLEVRIFDAHGTDELGRQEFALAVERSGSRYALPLSIKLLPDAKSKDIEFLLVITGIGPSGTEGSDVELVEERILTSFRPRASRRVDVFLSRLCLHQLCRDANGAQSALTCDANTGECVDISMGQDPDIDSDGGGPQDQPSDDASQDWEATIDAGNGDGGVDAEVGSSEHDASLGNQVSAPGTLGEPCSDEGVRACAGHNSGDALLCEGGKWKLRTVCDGNTRCDTRIGGMMGTCQNVAPACLGRQPHERVCEGTLVRICGADLLDSSETPCIANEHCVAMPTPHCECDTGFAKDTGGGCTNIDDCVANNCQHGGRCRDGVSNYSCDCSGTGYEGERCQSDVNECAQVTSCDPQYRCAQTLAPGYTCLGHMADWPMPDSAPGAKRVPSYDTSTSGVVKDRVTGLWWEANVDLNTYTWANAGSHCDVLVLDSRSDWRLPTKIELESIIDHAASSLALNPAFFSPGSEQEYWTSSTNIDAVDSKWTVWFADGGSYRAFASSEARARCVRSDVFSAGTPATRYQVSVTDGTVLDTRTTLTWQRAVDRQKRSLPDAVSYCQARGAGWRLPTLKELLTLVDPTTSPSIDLAAFPSTPTDWFQSSTLAAADAAQSWLLLFSIPNTTRGPSASGGLVRCVR